MTTRRRARLRAGIVHPSQLHDDAIAAWVAALPEDGPLRHPCLTPGFALAVGAARADARVAILADSDGRAGFFAYCLGARRVGRPLGLHLSDCQAVVAAPGLRWNAPALLEASGLAGFEYDHVPVEQREFRRGHRVLDPAPTIDLQGGFEAYLEQRRAHNRNLLGNLRRARRRLEHEHGIVRMEPQSGTRHLETLLRWKRDQYRRTGAADALATQWTRRVIQELLQGDRGGVVAELAALLVDDRPIALHLGLRAGSAMSSWFPAYDPTYAAASPGLLLLLDVVQEAASQGVCAIDLGRGSSEYKQRMKSNDRMLAQGWVGRPSLAARGRELRRRAAGAVASTPAAPAARRVRDSVVRFHRPGASRRPTAPQ